MFPDTTGNDTTSTDTSSDAAPTDTGPSDAGNAAPVASIALGDSMPNVGDSVSLDASGSSDPDGDSLTYSWSIQSAPSGSTATIDDRSAEMTSFTPDVAGDFTIELVADDGMMTGTATASLTASPVSCTEPRIIDSDITEDTTWSPTTADGCPDYRVTGQYHIQETLTIEPGVIVVFEQSAGLKVSTDTGVISARGSETNRIHFTGTNETRGHWEALVITTDSSDNVLEFVTFSYGGRGSSFSFSGDTQANVKVTDNALVSISSCVFEESQKFGLFLSSGARLSTFAGNRLQNNGGAPLHLDSNQLGMIPASTSFSGNGDSFVDVAASTTQTPQTWPAVSVPLRFEGHHYVETSDDTDIVHVEAGAEIVFAEGAGIRVDNGSFSCVGTSDNPIVIRGGRAEQGFWEALVFSTNKPDNRLEWVEISDGGKANSFSFSGDTPASVLITDDSEAAIVNTTFTNASENGLRLGGSAELSAFSENTFGGNGGPPIQLYSHQLGSLDAATDYDGDSISSPNGDEFIRVSNSTTESAQTWQKLDLPYRFFGKHYIEMSTATDVLTVEPGVTIQFGDGAGIRVNQGALSAVGTEMEGGRIRFIGAVAAEGYWEAIVFASNNPANEIAFAELAHGGKGSSFSFSGDIEAIVIVTSDAQATIRSCDVHTSPDKCFGGSGILNAVGNTLTDCN